MITICANTVGQHFWGPVTMTKSRELQVKCASYLDMNKHCKAKYGAKATGGCAQSCDCSCTITSTDEKDFALMKNRTQWKRIFSNTPVILFQNYYDYDVIEIIWKEE